MWNKKKIRFTDKKHSRQGIISSGLGGAALLLFAASVAAAYIRSGQAGRIIAVTGFLAMLCACAAPFCTGPVLLRDAGCTDKSYPGFWADYRRLRGQTEEV